MTRTSPLLFLVCSLAGCSDAKPAGAEGDDSGATALADSGAPSPAFDMPKIWGLESVADLNPADDIVEIELTADLAEVAWTESGLTEVWAYNGQVPGPLIQAKVGDTVRIHFTNALADENTIHWHGLRISDTMDGVPAIQAPVQTGETFTYEFVVPDAGTFWYHPHVRTHVAIERGLQGMFVVHDPANPVVPERAFVIDDVLLRGSAVDPSTMDHMAQMHGRLGNTLLANGQTEMLTATMVPGQPERWRIVNTANARTMWVRPTNARWRVIAVDGTLLPTPFETTRGLLPVGQRLDLEVIAEDGATEVGLQVELPDGSGGWSEYPVYSATVEGDSGDGAWTQWDAAALPEPEAAVQEGTLVLNAFDGTTTIDWTINGDVYGEHTPLEFAGNTPTLLTVRDRSRAEHPFHLHGQFFQILSRDGEVLPEDAGLRDTVLVSGSETLELYTNFDNPGRWMAHCHILEHAELGMMTEVVVSE